MSEVLNFEGGFRVQLFRLGRYMEWRLFNASGFLKGRGRELTKVKCERKWRTMLERLQESQKQTKETKA